MEKTVLSVDFNTSLPLQNFASDCMKLMGRRAKDVPDSNAPFYAVEVVMLRGVIDEIALRLMADLGTELRKAGTSLYRTVFEHFHREELKKWLRDLTIEVRRCVADPQHSASQRMHAIRLLPDLGGSFENALQAFPSLLAPNNDPEIIAATIETLGSYLDPAAADLLIEAWPNMTPALREKATTILLSRTERIAKLLDAIEAKKIKPAQFSVASRATLGRNKNPDIGARVTKLFGDSSNPNRKAVIDKYLAALTTKGDATRGAKVYELACMACHRHGSRGIDVGPHLATVKAWTPEQLLTNILDPNREVSPNFALYVIETKDGRTLSGLVMSETAGNVVLKRVDGGQESLLRSDIQSISSTGTSLMPEGVEAAITPEQMADLIEFLRQ